MRDVLRLWVITDGRLGHLNQLRGLVARLEAKRPCEVHWLDISQQAFKKTGRRNLLVQFAAERSPDWVIAAGSRCHLPLLWTSRFCGARSLVLMKPSLPLAWFDAAIIPAHDAPPQRPSVLVSQGVLNTMTPKADERFGDRGLVLLGGTNKHFAWDSAAIVAQLQAIIDAQPGVHWRVSDSPRSSAELLDKLRALPCDNMTIIPYSDCGAGWLPGQLAEVGQVWVSRDSVSMVYECITSGAPTGLLQLDCLRDSRVTRSMQQVIDKGLATAFERSDVTQALPPPSQPLWEADRAAEWLLERTESGS